MNVTLSVGVITPPFGNGLFVLAETSSLRFEQVVLAALPFPLPIGNAIVRPVLVLGLATVLPNPIG